MLPEPERSSLPLLAPIAGTGEILHGRLRKGSANTQRGTKRFVNELVARARRDDPGRALTVRFDSRFWNGETIVNLNRLNVRYTMGVRTSVAAVQTAIAGIADDAWRQIDYTCDGEAQSQNAPTRPGRAPSESRVAWSFAGPPHGQIAAEALA